MKKVILICFLFNCSFIFNSKLFAQQHKIDSLKKSLQLAKHDTLKLYTLNRLIEISPDGEWQKLNQELGQISKKIIDLNNTDKRSMHVAKRFYSSYINNIGYDEFEKGNVSKSIECYHQSLKLYEEIGEYNDVALAYNNLGYMYYNQNDYNTALDYYNRSLQTYQKLNFKWGIALCYNNIGLCYYNRLKQIIGNRNKTDSVNFNFEKAFWYYSNANTIQQQEGDLYPFATSANNIGTIYCLKARHYILIGGNKDSIKLMLNKSLGFHERALKIFIEIGNDGGIFDAKNNSGFVYFLLMNYNRAVKLCEESLKLAQERGMPQKISLAAMHLYQIYDSIGNKDNALKMYKLHIQMRDSITNDKNKRMLIQKEIQYKYDKKVFADSLKISEERKIVGIQLKQEKTLRYILFVGIGMILVFLFFLYSRFKVIKNQKQIIEEKKQEVEHQNLIITEQKALVEEHQKEILDSITYARRIQYALLAKDLLLKENLDNYFVLFKPKDIVSGDFYWATENNNKFYLAVCDSTGHGVPGAFMSLLNIGFLSEAIKEKGISAPHEVLNYVRTRLISSIGVDGQKDGMDCILMCVDKATKSISYSAANNAPVLISNNEIIDLEKNRMPVGKGERNESFTLYQLNYNKGDSLYLYTDGYADQFGGPKGKKFKYKALNELLSKLSDLPMEEQRVKIEAEFDNWKGDLEQVDDVCLIGIKL